MSPHVSVAELQAAWHAQSVDRSTVERHDAASDVEAAAAGRPRLGVAGVGGGVGTTTVALAIAEALAADVLLEWCPSQHSGLGSAPTVELGEDSGWSWGTRPTPDGGVLRIARQAAGSPQWQFDDLVVVEDQGCWDLSKRQPAVVVARCSVPGVRRLEAVLAHHPEAVPVLVGARVLPRPVLGAFGPILRRSRDAGRLGLVPECSLLRVTGITGEPLSKPLRRAGELIVSKLKETTCSG